MPTLRPTSGAGGDILLTRPSMKTSSLSHTTLAITINLRACPRLRAAPQLEHSKPPELYIALVDSVTTTDKAECVLE